MQDLSRRCIATRRESVSTYPRRPKAEAFSNVVDVVERLHNPTDPSTEHTAPPCSAHVQLDDVPWTLDPTEGWGRVPSAWWCYPLSMRWFSLEEERVMQQSSLSISLSFWEPRYRRLHSSRLVPAQTNNNLATNTIKGLSIRSRPLAKVRSNRDNKIR